MARAMGDHHRMSAIGDVSAPAVAIRRGTPADFPAISTLLLASGLPLDGLSMDHPFAAVAWRDGRLVGCAHVERYGASTLLRSVAVDADLRGGGIGRRLVETALAESTENATRTYLLTETAAGFFRSLGFRRISRTRVPSAVRESVEFTSACPASATAMSRSN
jgi:amino-acid N-acetyltransferase